MSIILYSYYRSSASYRVRIALNLKALDYQVHPVNLLKQGGQQHDTDYLSLNPQALVPTFVDENILLTQSSSIIEYLEDKYPHPPLLPADNVDRAYVRSIVQLIACDMHPLNNLRVLQYLENTLHVKDSTDIWYKHWIEQGFSALEKSLKNHDCNGRFCFGKQAGIADTFLIPQVYNALRFHCDLSYPLINRIYKHCLSQSEFIRAAPENQLDADKTEK
ncbi:MAG: maleylacetoacetate isomerase [Methylococcales bacterium]